MWKRSFATWARRACSPRVLQTCAGTGRPPALEASVVERYDLGCYEAHEVIDEMRALAGT
jgi:hypothetical protein